MHIIAAARSTAITPVRNIPSKTPASLQWRQIAVRYNVENEIQGSHLSLLV